MPAHLAPLEFDTTIGGGGVGGAVIPTQPTETTQATNNDAARNRQAALVRLRRVQAADPGGVGRVSGREAGQLVQHEEPGAR